MTRTRKKICILLTLAWIVSAVLTVLPLSVSAAGDTPEITLGSSGITYKKIFYFGVKDDQPIAWIVLSDGSDDSGTASRKGEALLLAKNGMGQTQYGNANKSTWSGSTAQEWCFSFLENWAEDSIERAAIKAAYAPENRTFKYTDAQGQTIEFELSYINTTDTGRFFFLSAREVVTYLPDKADRKLSGGYEWLLRSAHTNYPSKKGYVDYNGDLNTTDYNRGKTARPVFNLNLPAVLFTSENASETGTYKLTLEDSGRTIGIQSGASLTRDSETSVTVPYTIDSGSDHVSLLITNKDDTWTSGTGWSTGAEKQYYTTAAVDQTTGSVTFTLPDDYEAEKGSWQAYILAEKANGDKYSDYAGAPLAVTIPYVPHDHIWSDPGYTWAEDNSTAAALRTCSICGEEDSETVDTSFADDPAATCGTAGTRTYTAAFTSTAFGTQTKEVTVPAMGHDLEDHPAKAATCSAVGWDAYQTCTRCDYSTYAEIPTLAHTPGSTTKEEHVDSTCLVAGSEYEVVKCVVCGNVISREKVTLPLAPHTLDSHEAVAATCAVPGNIAYWTCSVCGKYFSDQNAENEIEEDGITVTAPHDLDYHGAITESCTSDGQIAHYHCKNCGKCFSDAAGTDELTAAEVTIPAHGHKEGEPKEENRKEATCSQAGEYYVNTYCTYCGTPMTSHHETIPKLDHTYGERSYVWDDNNLYVAASCTCSVCGYEKTGGSRTTSVTTQATCTSAGATVYTTTELTAPFENQTKSFPIAKLPHTMSSHTPAAAADCATMTAGNVEYWHCSSCEKNYSDEQGTTEVTDVTVPAVHTLEHHAAASPDCTNDGSIEYWQCSVCQGYFTDAEGTTGTTAEGIVDPKLGHDEVPHEAKAPTCTEVGWDAYDTCRRQGCTYTTYAEKPALGHDEVPHDAKAATCEEIGWDAYKTCSRCDYTTKAEIPALGHDWQTTYTWADDNSTCKAEAVCRRDNTHTRDETVNTTGAVTTQATCEGTGKTTYTAVFTKAGFSAQKKEVVTASALGHALRHHPAVAATTEATGTEQYWDCTRCGKLFSDAGGTRQITAAAVIPKLAPAAPPEPADKVEAFVTRCYRVILGREPDAGGLAYWVDSLKSGKEKASEIINGFVTSNEFVNRHYSDETAVEILYNAMLGRGPDEGGKNYWLSVLNGGNPFATVINGFCTSNEFASLCASYGIQPGSVETGPMKPPKPVKDMTKIRAFVTRCYKVILSRDPDPTGLEYWAKALSNGSKEASEIIDGFVNSNEYRAKHLGYEDSVEVLYNAMLGRGSDAGGKAYWVGQLQGGNPFAVIINGFCTSNEFINLCNLYGITPGSVKIDTVRGIISYGANGPEGGVTVSAKRLDEEKLRAYIRKAYTVLLGREATEDETVFWAGSILADHMTVAKALHDIVLSNEFSANRPDNAEVIRRMYRIYTGREPAEGEANAWISRLDAGESLEVIANGFAASREFKNILSTFWE